MLNSIFALAVILSGAFGIYALWGINSRMTPLVSLVVLVDIAALFAMGGMLKTGVIIAYVFALTLFTLACVKNKADIAEKAMDFFSPGVVMFLLASLAMLAVLYATQPVIHRWDEFSFWGISQKLVKNHDALYTFYSSSMLGQSIPPALAVLSYFFQRFTPEFVEWACYYAYDVMFFACFAAFTAAFGKNRAHNAVTVFILAFISPYLFRVLAPGGKIADMYISTYADIPMAMVFAAATAVYFFTKENDSRSIMPVLPVLFFLTLIKDMGLALSCIVVFVIFFDMLVSRRQFSFLRLKGFLAECAAAVSMLLVTVSAYIMWSVHISNVLAINRSDFGGESGMGMVQMLVTGVKALLLGTTDEKFLTVRSSIIQAFFNTKVSMFGSGLNVVIIISAIFALAFLLSDKTGRKRIWMMYITSWTGFIGYYIFHLFLYAYVFGSEAYTLASYDRYMYTFYIGWLMLAVCCVCLAVRDGYSVLAGGGLLAVLAACLVICNMYMDIGNTFLAVNDTAFSKRQLIDAKSRFISDVVEEDDVIFLFSADNNGAHWFIYSYNFIDNYFPPEVYIETWGMSPEEEKATRMSELTEYMLKNGVTHILVDHSNEELSRNYGDVFGGMMYLIGHDTVAYYKVHYTDTAFWCELVKEGSIYG
ncbi:MAG: hypothetical protein IKU54_05535 [Oscillospiraceae bacterium]|nr:hypothetical protein [Oscillospiraceae bacterium]